MLWFCAMLPEPASSRYLGDVHRPPSRFGGTHRWICRNFQTLGATVGADDPCLSQIFCLRIYGSALGETMRWKLTFVLNPGGYLIRHHRCILSAACLHNLYTQPNHLPAVLQTGNNGVQARRSRQAHRNLPYALHDHNNGGRLEKASNIHHVPV